MSAASAPFVLRRQRARDNHQVGGWKIALADLMTALMALFLVLWILSGASDTQRQQVSDYFNSPLNIRPKAQLAIKASSQVNGEGLLPGSQGVVLPAAQQRPAPAAAEHDVETLRWELDKVMTANPKLQRLKSQLRVAAVAEGMKVELSDSTRETMFQLGSGELELEMRELLAALAPVLNKFPQAISITGHTDSLTYPGQQAGYSNWELSSARANASRRQLVSAGLAPGKVIRVSGVANMLPIKDQPIDSPMNRRIEILLLDDVGRTALIDSKTPEDLFTGTSDATRPEVEADHHGSKRIQ
ncbi:hypothetical protein BST95_07510 [Halioglobus japonicus]|uniref:Flagellar motor protein MotB n=1 Tax=Halioglobus japonicus TaxID=930805 RepID=A0AAP8ME44_9GAMM|nr:flagellar motor protein MotB [Halioglobus japonicus]AQA18111.1 hypothetical protein BST95_07510 [Halioglobus japonicus]PLW86105.1 flagellar motor protein MotB [Halioglobus japonicus]GHD14450.1 hypothetical protein GCM10007052_18190 [Halioglobus japonicus]